MFSKFSLQILLAFTFVFCQFFKAGMYAQEEKRVQLILVPIVNTLGLKTFDKYKEFYKQKLVEFDEKREKINEFKLGEIIPIANDNMWFKPYKRLKLDHVLHNNLAEIKLELTKDINSALKNNADSYSILNALGAIVTVRFNKFGDVTRLITSKYVLKRVDLDSYVFKVLAPGGQYIADVQFIEELENL